MQADGYVAKHSSTKDFSVILLINRQKYNNILKKSTQYYNYNNKVFLKLYSI